MTQREPMVVVVLEDGDPHIETVRNFEGTSINKASGFDGVGLINIFVNLAPASIAAIALIARENIAARKYVRVKYKGVEIRGVSEKKLDEILAKVAQEPKFKNK